MTSEVFLLWHEHVLPGGEEDAKLLGVFSSREAAERTQLRAKTWPGFSDTPEGFEISRYEVDKEHWVEGYFTYLPPRAKRKSPATKARRGAGSRTKAKRKKTRKVRRVKR